MVEITILKLALLFIFILSNIVHAIKILIMDDQKDTIPFARDAHVKYLLNLDSTKDSDAIGHYTNEHLKLPGGYWCIGSLSLLKALTDDRKKEIVQFVKAC